MNKRLLIQCDCERCKVLIKELLQHNWNTEIKEDKKTEDK